MPLAPDAERTAEIRQAIILSFLIMAMRIVIVAITK
jgi:hypothetical protein